MAAISNRLPEIWVSYQRGSQRVSKHFPDAIKAKRFYTQKFKQGLEPKLHKENPTMATSKTSKATKAQPKKSTGKRVPKKPARKPAAKRAPAKRKPAAKKAEVNLRKPQQRILDALNKPMTRKQLCDKVGLGSAGFTYYVGSVDKDVREANDKRLYISLISHKLVKVEVHDVDGKDVVTYSRVK